ncbi:WD repeat-containing protein 90 [Phytophthora boehmeriae]|uniref:WD repeat-containing protein 90 n=1 Tax=Phytophthora boehmeriae TaxID=109152 RepID=A0A8T1WLJ0_9STRA|nr:WD repeat-containing protein 90 [Phytophthora boehmeriae]
MALARHSHFLAHSSNVNCLRFGRKSGQVAATGGDDHLVNLWRMREKETKNIMSLSGHQSAVESVVFDPAERKVVAGSQAGSIKVFDLEAGKVNRTLKGHMASTTTVDYHLYGDYVASGSRDTIVKVWDLRTKSCMQTFKGHSSEVTAVSFTPDGRWLTSGEQDGVIKIWDLTAGRLLHEFPDHGGAITNLEFNPEEFILVSSSADRTVRFWDVQEFALIGVTPVDNATTTSMCHTVTEPYSGKYLFCCSQEAIRVWSYETAIECHDSIAMPRQKDMGFVETHADTTMTQDMKLMGGCIQDAFVSVTLPKGKREAVVVDVLRTTDLPSLGVDLEACVLLLPLIAEVLDSKFELYLSVGIDSAHKLFDVFSPIIKDARDARQYRSREINLAGEERAQRCNACDAYFQQIQQRLQHLDNTCLYTSLQAKTRAFAQVLNDFSRL